MNPTVPKMGDGCRVPGDSHCMHHLMIIGSKEGPMMTMDCCVCGMITAPMIVPPELKCGNGAPIPIKIECVEGKTYHTPAFSPVYRNYPAQERN